MRVGDTLQRRLFGRREAFDVAAQEGRLIAHAPRLAARRTARNQAGEAYAALTPNRADRYGDFIGARLGSFRPQIRQPLCAPHKRSSDHANRPADGNLALIRGA